MSFILGYINPVIYTIPVGIDVKVDKQTLINVKGSDKRLVGQVAANLRAIKPPDVYTTFAMTVQFILLITIRRTTLPHPVPHDESPDLSSAL